MQNNAKPITHQGNLAKLPKALALLIARPQWAVWRWTQKPDGSWQKPPFQALQPDRHASTSDPSTWTNYTTALATVQAGRADGLSYILTGDDPFGAIDLDHCRCTVTNSIDVWAQNYLQAAIHTYSEVTPSGQGGRRVRAQISEADVSGSGRVQRLSSLAPKNPRKAVAVDEHTRVQSEAPQTARLLLAF